MAVGEIEESFTLKTSISQLKKSQYTGIKIKTFPYCSYVLNKDENFLPLFKNIGV